MNEEQKLALWIKEQKLAYKKGTLTKRQIKLLEDLPNWTWDLPQDTNKENDK